PSCRVWATARTRTRGGNDEPEVPRLRLGDQGSRHQDSGRQDRGDGLLRRLRREGPGGARALRPGGVIGAQDLVEAEPVPLLRQLAHPPRPQLLGEADGAGVLLADHTDDAIASERSEAVGQRGSNAFRRVALAPRLARERPPDLEAVPALRLEE